MKKFIGLLLILSTVLFFSACGDGADNQVDSTGESEESTAVDAEGREGSEEADAETEKNAEVIAGLDGWQKAYVEFILELKDCFEKGKSEREGYLAYVQLNDLNMDGVPELLVSDDGASASPTVGFYQLIDGKVMKIGGYTAAQDYLEGKDMVLDTAGLVPYARMGSAWITLRKNVNTGELKYFLGSHNGTGCESFGETVGVVIGDNGEIGSEKLFEYLEVYEDFDQEKIQNSEYTVSGTTVSKEDYDKKYEEFEKEWVDTDFRTPVMGANPERYEKCAERDFSAQGLADFMGMYVPEG